MPSQSVIAEFLAQEHLAFVGVSRTDNAFANSVYRHLRDNGAGGRRTMYPVHPQMTLFDGDDCYPGLLFVPDPVDGVVVMVSAERAKLIVAEAITRGIPRVWLHQGAGPGAVSAEAVQMCRDAGVAVVDGACPLMFDGSPGFVHRAHRFLRRRHLTV